MFYKKKLNRETDKLILNPERQFNLLEQRINEVSLKLSSLLQYLNLHQINNSFANPYKTQENKGIGMLGAMSTPSQNTSQNVSSNK